MISLSKGGPTVVRRENQTHKAYKFSHPQYSTILLTIPSEDLSSLENKGQTHRIILRFDFTNPRFIFSIHGSQKNHLGMLVQIQIGDNPLLREILIDGSNNLPDHLR
jgi:hypothetical protein